MFRMTFTFFASQLWLGIRHAFCVLVLGGYGDYYSIRTMYRLIREDIPIEQQHIYARLMLSYGIMHHTCTNLLLSWYSDDNMKMPYQSIENQIIFPFWIIWKLKWAPFNKYNIQFVLMPTSSEVCSLFYDGEDLKIVYCSFSKQCCWCPHELIGFSINNTYRLNVS